MTNTTTTKTTYKIYDRRNNTELQTVVGTTVDMHDAARAISLAYSPKSPSVEGAKPASIDVRVVLSDGSERFHCGYDDEGHLVDTK